LLEGLQPSLLPEVVLLLHSREG